MSIRLNNVGGRVFNDPANRTPSGIGQKGRGIVFNNPNPINVSNLPPPLFYAYNFQTFPTGLRGGDPRFNGRPDSRQMFNNGSFVKGASSLITDRAFYNNQNVDVRILENFFKYKQNYQLADYYYDPRLRYLYTWNPQPIGTLTSQGSVTRGLDPPYYPGAPYYTYPGGYPTLCPNSGQSEFVTALQAEAARPPYAGYPGPQFVPAPGCVGCPPYQYNIPFTGCTQNYNQNDCRSCVIGRGGNSINADQVCGIPGPYY